MGHDKRNSKVGTRRSSALPPDKEEVHFHANGFKAAHLHEVLYPAAC